MSLHPDGRTSEECCSTDVCICRSAGFSDETPGNDAGSDGDPTRER